MAPPTRRKVESDRLLQARSVGHALFLLSSTPECCATRCAGFVPIRPAHPHLAGCLQSSDARLDLSLISVVARWIAHV